MTQHVNPCTGPECGAPIFWARTAAGRSMPLDAAPDPEGNVVLLDEMAVVLGPKATQGAALVGAKRYRPHWATCPHSRNFRKRAGG